MAEVQEPIVEVPEVAEVAEAEEEVAAEGGDDIDNEIQELEQEMEFMEKETNQVRELSEIAGADPSTDLMEADKRSIYIGNVDYGATPEELQEHFKSCGAIARITIMVDKFTCSPKGFAYMEFVEESSVTNAVLLNDSLFRGRQLKVNAKRTNVPGFNKGKGKKGKSPKGKGKAPWPGYAPVGWVPTKGKGKKKGFAPY